MVLNIHKGTILEVSKWVKIFISTKLRYMTHAKFDNPPVPQLKYYQTRLILFLHSNCFILATCALLYTPQKYVIPDAVDGINFSNKTDLLLAQHQRDIDRQVNLPLNLLLNIE